MSCVWYDILSIAYICSSCKVQRPKTVIWLVGMMKTKAEGDRGWNREIQEEARQQDKDGEKGERKADR